MKIFILILVLVSYEDNFSKEREWIDTAETKVEFFVDAEESIKRLGKASEGKSRLFQIDFTGSGIGCYRALRGLESKKINDCVTIKELFVAPSKQYTITHSTSVRINQ